MNENRKIKEESNFERNEIIKNNHKLNIDRRKGLHRKTETNLLGNEDYQSLMSLDEDIYKKSKKTRNKSCFEPKMDDKPLLYEFKQQNKEESEFDIESLNSSELNSSIIIKENNSEKNINVIKNYDSNKSFIPLINTLKYTIDKEESATDSYLLALGQERGKTASNFFNNYPFDEVSIIEEEKSNILYTDFDSTNKKSYQ